MYQDNEKYAEIVYTLSVASSHLKDNTQSDEAVKAIAKKIEELTKEIKGDK